MLPEGERRVSSADVFLRSILLISLLLAPVLHAGEVADLRLGHEAKFLPFLQKHCIGCHGAEKQKAGMNIEAFLENGKPKIEDRREWETILELIMSREMPPEDKPQPSEPLRHDISDYLEAHLESFDCSGPTTAGAVTARRLNRDEYANTIRDLTGVTFKASEAFPRDEVGYGFDNIGDVLSLSPLLMEKYLDAAETIVDEAMLSEVPPWPPVKRFEESDLTPKGGDAVRIVRERYLGLYREGSGEVVYEAPAKGQYLLQIRAFQDKAGPEHAKMAVTINRELVAEVDVTAEGRQPEIFRMPVQLDQGKATISVAYTNNYVDSQNRNPELRGDRNLFIDYVEVEGPSDLPRPPLPATHMAIIPSQPQAGEEKALAREIFQGFASKAFRRPVTPNELDRLTALTMSIFDEDESTFEGSVKVGVMAVLASPHFLYRWELDDRQIESEARVLGGHELAARLSYFLWSSMPDEELTQMASKNQLGELPVLRAQVKRMLADPKANALVSNFTGQWLQTRNLATVAPNPETFPEFDESLRVSMQQETELFVQSIVDDDLSVLSLLDADYTFLNERLARHYGIEGVQGDGFQRVALDRSSRRGGILTQASILTITSEETRTSPVVRGKWVLEQILGTPPPPPPPDVAELEESKEAHESASLRERLEMHRNHPDCAGCHAKMDPIGFALENYDAIGRWRDTDGDFPIDPAGKLVGGIEIGGPEDLKRALVQKERFVETLSEKLLTYALGRGTEYYDKCAIDLIVEQLKANDHRFSSLVDAIVTSEPFLKRQRLPSS